MRDKVRIECDVTSLHLTIYECHAPWGDDRGPEWSRTPAARLRYTQKTATWTLNWPDRNSHFHKYDGMSPTSDIAILLSEIDRDPTAIFWG